MKRKQLSFDIDTKVAKAIFGKRKRDNRSAEYVNITGKKTTC